MKPTLNFQGLGTFTWLWVGQFLSIFGNAMTRFALTIWAYSQACVAHKVQGRVLAAKNMIQVGSMPLGYLLAGVLADRVFEPAMAAGGSFAGVFGPLGDRAGRRHGP
jgi:hypothetical protein